MMEKTQDAGGISDNAVRIMWDCHVFCRREGGANIYRAGIKLQGLTTCGDGVFGALEALPLWLALSRRSRTMNGGEQLEEQV